MITPNFDNVSNCKLYNQDTGELVAVGKITDASPVFEKVSEENLDRHPAAMTFDACSITFSMPPARGDSKSTTYWFESFITGLYMEETIMKYSRHNSFDILKAIDDESRTLGTRMDIYKKVLLGILEQRKKCPRGKRNVHRRKYTQKTLRIK